MPKVLAWPKVKDRSIHVMPFGDLVEHQESRACWCVPTPHPEEPLILVHHSADGREVDEMACEVCGTPAEDGFVTADEIRLCESCYVDIPAAPLKE